MKKLILSVVVCIIICFNPYKSFTEEIKNSVNKNIAKSHLKLSKNLSLSEFKKLEIPIIKSINVNSASKKYRANVEVIVSSMLGASTLNNDLYFYAFKDNKLIYWGYPYQFRKNNNELIREVGDEAFSLVMNNQELKALYGL